MILTCPSCSTKFMISSEALGENGREVRCSKCTHVWFQAAERDSIDELTSAQGFNPWNEADLSAPVEREHEDIEIDMEDQSRIEKVKISIPRESRPLNKYARHSMAVFLALVIVTGLVFSFISLRAPISASSSFFEAAYTKFGYASKKSKPKLSLDRVKLTRDGTKISGTGHVINLTSDVVPVELVRVHLEDLNGKSLQSSDIKIDEKTIKGEASRKIDFSFKDVPKDAVDVRVEIVK